MLGILSCAVARHCARLHDRPNLAGTLAKPREPIGKQKNDTILRWCRDMENSPKGKESLNDVSQGGLARTTATTKKPLTQNWQNPCESPSNSGHYRTNPSHLLPIPSMNRKDGLILPQKKQPQKLKAHFLMRTFSAEMQR